MFEVPSRRNLIKDSGRVSNRNEDAAGVDN